MQFMSMSAQAFRDMVKKPNKFHAQKTVINGVVYDSKKESRRAVELEYLEKAGKIKNLERQKRFVLQEGFVNNEGKKIRPISYLADYYYEKDGQKVVEDVKSPATRTQVYMLKKKLFMFKYPDIKFVES